jgi:hypothetical protein
VVGHEHKPTEKRPGDGVSTGLVFVDQVSRFVFGLAAAFLGLLLLNGETQAKFLLAVSVVSFAALIVRWGADHTYYFAMINADRATARRLAANALVLSVGVAAVVVLCVFAYFVFYPGMLALGLPALILLAIGTAQQVSAPLEVYLRVHGNLGRAMTLRICLQAIMLGAKIAALTWWGITEFAAITALEALGMTAIYVRGFGKISGPNVGIRLHTVMEQLRTGVLWGGVALATMTMSVLIASTSEQALPPETAAVFLFAFRLLGAVNNVVGAAGIAVSHKLIGVQSPLRMIDIISVATASISVAGIGMVFLFAPTLPAPFGMGGAWMNWSVALGGMAALIPTTAGAALTGRFLIIGWGARVSLLRLLLAVGVVFVFGGSLTVQGLWGAVALVFLGFATILLSTPIIARLVKPLHRS